MKNKLLALIVLLVACTVLATSHTPRKQLPPNSDSVKLEYGNPDLKSKHFATPAIPPIPMSLGCLLVPVGDMLYLLEANNRIVWEYSFEPNVIRDVMVDPKGDIYVTASEALILVLNASGKEVWRTGMGSGSAGYGEIQSYANGFLVIVDMESYRMKGSKSEDVLEFWKDRKQRWSKPFPRGAKLQIAGNRILAIATTHEGREITAIR